MSLAMRDEPSPCVVACPGHSGWRLAFGVTCHAALCQTGDTKGANKCVDCLYLTNMKLTNVVIVKLLTKVIVNQC